MNKNLIITAFIGLLTIILGAFGTHILAEKLSLNSLKSFEIAVQYQMFHVIVLLFVNTYNGFTDKNKKYISLLFLFGILLFSGSIYLITIGGISAKSIWFVTPLGGLTFIVGWILMLIAFIKK